MYDYTHYNSPEQGNKHIYPFGERYDGLDYCGFIQADNKKQALTVLRAYNRVWNVKCILLDYAEEECRTEYRRREEKYKQKQTQQKGSC